MSYGNEIALLLLAGAVAGLQRNMRGFSCACAVAATALAAAGAAHALRVAAEVTGETVVHLAASSLIALFALGIAGYHMLKPTSLRFAAIAAAALTSAGTAAAVAVGGAFGPNTLPVSAQLMVQHIAIVILSSACVAFLFVAPIAPPGTTLRWLRAPLGVAGALSTAALLATLMPARFPDPASLPLIAVLGTACCMLIVAAIVVCSFGAVMLDLDSAAEKSNRALQRQRQIMHSRAHVLRQSQKRYKELFRSVQVAVLMTHPSGAIIAANPAMLDMLGVDSEEKLRDVNFRDVYANPEERNALINNWHASNQDLWKGEVKLKRLDGQEITCLYTARIIRGQNDEIEYHQGIFTDITALRRAETERRALEAHLRLSQKLESVGRLAMGIAHEINTPMQYMGDNVYFLKQAFTSLRNLIEDERRLLRERNDAHATELLRSLDEPESRSELEHMLNAAPEALDRITQGIDAVNRIVAAIKELAYPAQHAKVRTDLNALVRTALVVSSNEYKTVASIKTSFGDIPDLLTHKNELCQVFINMIVNAAHAIDTVKRQSGRIGVIRIETSVVEDHVLIRFIDNGCGIPQAALDKIFDPFFTTKEVGKGTGQGLAIASRAVDAHGGRIDVDSRPGLGSTFTVRLPMEQANQKAEPDEEVRQCQPSH